MPKLDDAAVSGLLARSAYCWDPYGHHGSAGSGLQHGKGIPGRTRNGRSGPWHYPDRSIGIYSYPGHVRIAKEDPHSESRARAVAMLSDQDWAEDNKLQFLKEIINTYQAICAGAQHCMP